MSVPEFTELSGNFQGMKMSVSHLSAWLARPGWRVPAGRCRLRLQVLGGSRWGDGGLPHALESRGPAMP